MAAIYSDRGGGPVPTTHRPGGDSAAAAQVRGPLAGARIRALGRGGTRKRTADRPGWAPASRRLDRHTPRCRSGLDAGPFQLGPGPRDGRRRGSAPLRLRDEADGANHQHRASRERGFAARHGEAGAPARGGDGVAREPGGLVRDLEIRLERHVGRLARTRRRIPSADGLPLLRVPTLRPGQGPAMQRRERGVVPPGGSSLAAPRCAHSPRSGRRTSRSRVRMMPPARTTSTSVRTSRSLRIMATAMPATSSARRSMMARATRSPEVAASKTSGASSRSRDSGTRSR